jgi:transposase
MLLPEGGMEQIPLAEMERTMKVQEVILRAMAKKITWWQAAEILGISNRTMRRWKWNYENKGFKGLLDKRRGKTSWNRVAPGKTERILALYRDEYFDLNVRHFYEQATALHGVTLSYTWGEELAARCGSGQEEPGSQTAPETPTTPADSGHAAAYRWQSSSVVSG